MCEKRKKKSVFTNAARISDYLQPLETTIFTEFIPAVTGKFVSDLDRELFSLPARMGGLGL